ncbi:MAG TPA: penicillin-binding transpeptidase domain-containing protein [Bacillota bacterium]|nr:penicillin-binding transpeptidase domain-containing protein [Bacillota bacterium]
MKNNILRLGCLLFGLFLVLTVYLAYLQVWKGPALAANSYNRRFQEQEARIRRGTIYDIKGAVLARTEFSDGKGRRIYPEGTRTAHIVGYVSERYGRSGLESFCDPYLLGMEGPDRVRNRINNLLGREQAGGDVVLTIDSDLQGMAVELLGGRRGAAVLLDPRTGAVRAIVSSPGFNPNYLEETWPRLVNDESAPLMNRAAQGAYPPGSTFKIVTAAGALAGNPGVADMTFDCAGYIVADGYKLDDVAAHGKVDLRKALAVSCNSAFAQLGLNLGAEGFYRAVKAFGIREPADLGIPVRAGTLAPPGEMTQSELASSAIGQGQILVSPLQMALVAGAIANKGKIMKPYLVESVRDSCGGTIHKAASHVWLDAAAPDIAEIIKEGMVDAVRSGTAGAASVAGVQIAGKTGSAQNPQGMAHAWFIGFAPADSPRLAAAVILENAGSGGAVAAPVAGRLLAYAVSRGY